MTGYVGTDDRSGETMLACEECGETWPEGRFEGGECPDCRGEVSCQFCGAEATARVLVESFNGPPEDVPACDECADREGHNG